MKTPQDIINKRKELWAQYQDIEKDRGYTQAVAEYLLSPEGETLRIAIKSNPEYLIEMVFVVVDKEQQTVPFFLNDIQQSFIEDLNKAKQDYKAGKRNHLKFLILKGRQGGFTSVITAYQTTCAIVQRNFSGFTLADSGDNSNTIFEDKAKFPYNNLPSQLRPTEKYNNRREFHFEKLNSRWRVSTAGNKEVGRSKTINFFHGSEAAFWPELNNILTGLGEALTKDSIQILETTANGFNEYKELWDGAEKGSNNWEAKFYPWWLTKEYVTPFENDLAEQDFKDSVFSSNEWIFQKCKWLHEFIKLEWTQIYWYFNKWKDLKEKLKQEYPCTPEEAFLSSGIPVFDLEKVLQRKKQLEALYEANKPLKGNFIYEYKNEKIIDSSIKFKPDPNGVVTIYEYPEPRVPYVTGGDIAEGGIDYSVGQLLNNITGKQAAVWHSHTDTDLYAKQMYCLGKFYNNALLAIEMNFDLHPVKELQRLGYYRQFRREIIDDITKKKQHKYGFMTTSVTRPVIIAELVEIVRESIELINDIPTLDEMLRFVRNTVGKPEAMDGFHDDLIMALAIAYKARSQQSMVMEEIEDYEPEYETAFGRTGY